MCLGAKGGLAVSAPLKIVAPSIMRQFVEPLLPEGLALSWFNDPNEAIAMVRDAEVGWLDQFSWNDSADAIFAGEKLKWVNTLLAGQIGKASCRERVGKYG